MKALTVRQPWAQLIMRGGKDIENRDWPTKIRGRVAIHSSARIDRREIESACDFMATWVPRFSSRIFTAEAINYPVGCILGTVEIINCVGASESPWFVGDYGFVLRDPQPFDRPIPAKGALGFWEWNA